MDSTTVAALMVGIAVGKPALGLVRDFLGRVLAPSGDALGQTLAYPIQQFNRRRIERAERMVIGAAAIVAQAGETPLQVPGRVLFPILEKGSVEEDSELQLRWMTLLASSAMPSKHNWVLPGFAEILSQLTPIQAAILDWMYDCLLEGGFMSPNRESGEIQKQFGLDDREYGLYASDLVRLGLIQRARVAFKDAWEDDGLHATVTLTPLGQNFVVACRPPKPAEIAAPF